MRKDRNRYASKIMFKTLLKILVAFILLFVNIKAQAYYWEKSDKPEGGVVYSLLVRNDTLIIGSKGGVYISKNLGETWSPIGLQSLEVWDVEFCGDYIVSISSDGCYRKKLNDNDWEKIKDGRYQALSAKDSLIYLGSEYEGIFRSIDYGRNWEQINNGIDNRDIEEIYFTSSNVLLASAAGTSGSGVFRSLDLGDSWSRIDPYQFAWNFHGISEIDSILYAFDFSNSAKIYKSTDNGLSWFLPSGSSPPSDIINTIYGDSDGLYTGVYHYGFFSSKNEGVSWSKNNNGLQNLTLSEIGGNSTSLFLATFDGFYKSNKSSINWKRYMHGISDVNVYSLSQNSKYLFVGTSGSGLFRATKDLSVWEEMNLGTNNKFITSILALENTVLVLVSSWTNHYYEELYISINNGISWQKLNPNLDSAELETIVGNKDVQFIGSGYGVFRSTNYGNSWVKMGNGMPSNINSSSIAVYESVVIVTNGTSGIYRSVDLGESWTYTSVPNLFSGKALSVSSDGIFYLGSDNRIFKSDDLGKTWSNLNNPSYNSTVNSIAIDSNIIFLGLSRDGVITSSDGGKSWMENNSGLINKNVNCVSVLGPHGFVGTRSGLYKVVSSAITPISNNTIELNRNSVLLSWQKSPGINKYHLQVSTDSLFRSVIIDKILMDTSYSTYNLDYLTTYYWRVSTVTDYWDDKYSAIQKIVISNPIDYELSNNYPNPFNNETNIRVDVPYESEIKLILYNVLGEMIKTIIDASVEAGSHHYNVAADNLASGIYFIRLIGQNYSKTKKAVLLR